MSTLIALLAVMLSIAACVFVPVRMKKNGKGKNSVQRILIGLAVALGIFIFMMIIMSNFKTDEERAEEHIRDSIRNVERKVKDSIAAEDARINDSIEMAMRLPHWTERTSKDEMTDETNVWMSLLSDNEYEFDFPYNGGSKLQIDVRYRKQDGTQVILTLSKGQLQTTGFDNGHKVVVRFDEDAPMSFTTSEPSDYSTSYLFLNNPRKFINRAKTAKKIKIQVPVYDEGQPVFEFSPAEPLVWNK
jgi:low affinity Fe/Cu permease